MAFNHHHNNHHHHNHQYTAPSCHCQQPPCHSHHPPPSPLQYDPLLISTIVSQILHSQSQSPPSNPFNNETQPSFYSSLLNRIHKLETTLSHFSLSSSSSSNSSYLKDVAARVIQTHFRKFLVHRSKTLRELKQLANVKSNLTFLKSSFSLHGVLDFGPVSNKAVDLLLLIDSLKGEDKMIRDSKKSITREIYQFLEMIDEVCSKRHQVMTRKIRSMRLVRNDNSRSSHDIRGHSKHGGGSKSQNVDNEEKKLIANLRKRVERIGKMSRELEEEEEEEEEVEGDESEGFEHLGDEDNSGYFNLNRSKYSSNNKSWSHAGGSKGQNVDNEGNRMMANLRERVEKIGKMSRALEEEEVVDDSVEDGGGNFNRIRSKYGPSNGVTNDKSASYIGRSNGQNVDDEENRMMASLRKRVEKIGKMSRALEEENVVDDESEGFSRLGDEGDDTFNHIRSVSPSNGKKRVCFVEDGNMIRVHNVDLDKIATRDVEEIEDFTNGGQDEDEARSDGHPSTESSEDVSSSSRTYEVHGNEIHNKEFTFPAPRPGVKIAK